MLRHLPVCAVLLLAALPAFAQDRPATEQKSGTYVVKYAAAKDLADVLAKHFRGAAEIKIGPDGASNSLLINAPPAVLEEVMKTLEQFDRRPRSVAVDIFIVELSTNKGDIKERPDEKDFSGAINDVAERLDAMKKKGWVADFRRIQLTTPEGQSSLQDLARGSNLWWAGVLSPTA
jgi:hypothetical protein